MLEPFPSSDLEALKALVDQNNFFVILCHTNPDGDAIGSSCGLAEYLRAKGKSATVIVPDAYPDFLNWVPGVQESVRADKYPEKAALMLKTADVIFVLDLNEPKRTESMEQLLVEARQPKVLVDHHLNPADFCTLTFSRPQASSASELIYRLIDGMGDAAVVNKSCATCLYTGIMTDTGAFAFSSSDPELFVIVSHLLERGIDKDRIYNRVFHCYSRDRLQFFGYMLYQNMRVYPDKRAALLTLTKKEMERFNLLRGETDGLVNQPLQIRNVDFVCFLREDTERPHINVSLRSEGSFPCNKFAARYFNGGGHLNASGGRYFGSLDDAVKIFEEALNNFDPNA